VDNRAAACPRQSYASGFSVKLRKISPEIPEGLEDASSRIFSEALLLSP
jgi:hypothetical protein